jgi:hypothetical protein
MPESSNKGASGNRPDASSMFRPSALNHMTSADQLDRYIVITNPSGWIVLIAAVIYLVSILVWASTSAIPVNKTFTGMMADDAITCWVDEEAYQTIKRGGTVARVYGVKLGAPTEVRDLPLSEYELATYYGDYLTDNVKTFEWNYLVTFNTASELNSQVEGTEMRLVPVDFTMSLTTPVKLVLGED